MTRFAITGSCVLPLLFVVGGCAVGNSKYGCPGMPDGVMCASAHDIYEMTGRGESTAATKVAKTKSDAALPSARPEYLPEMAGGVIPLRTPAKVMRIWINAWEGKNDDLNVAGLVYTEIEPRRWQIGLPAIKQPAELVLLDPKPSAPVAPPKPASGGAPTSAATKAVPLPSPKRVTGDH